MKRRSPLFRSALLVTLIGIVLLGCAPATTPSPSTVPAKPAVQAPPVPAAAAPTTAPVAAPQPAQPTAAAAAPAPAVPAVPRPATYKIGHYSPLTGPMAEYGKSFSQAAQNAVEEINSKGGINGVKYELFTEDSMGDPKQGITAFAKLVQVNKAPVIIGAISSVVAAVAPVADENQVTTFNYGAQATNLRGIGKFTFTSFQLADVNMKVLAGYAYDKLNARKAAIIYINNDTGRTNAEAYKAGFEGKGGKVVASETFQPDALDFGAQLSKIKAAEPDVLHIAPLSELPRIVRQAREVGIKAQFTSYETAEAGPTIDQGGEAADGLVFSFLGKPDSDPDVKAFMDGLRAKYEGKLPVSVQTHVYIWDLLTVIVPQAIKYADQKGWGYTGESIRRAVAEVKSFDTKLTGKTVFQFPGQDVTKPVTIKKVNVKNKSFDTIAVIDP